MKVMIAGHCSYDTTNLSNLLSQIAEVETVVTRTPQETLAELARTPFRLVLLNRVFEEGRENGLEMIPQFKKISPATNIMLISNFQDAQTAAVEAGAIPGFGKRALAAAETREMLQRSLMVDASGIPD